MRILGIETSCDETAAAVVVDGVMVESSVIASTKDIFKAVGGVVPEDAARRQLEYIIPAIRQALSDANVTQEAIDVIAVTKGPGLLGSLLGGTTAARVLSSVWQKPLVGVHHTFGHLTSPWLAPNPRPNFPCITLSASGGHTDLWYRTSHTKGTLLGRTRDDAAGEAFDKGAKLLGLPYPGGPSIANAADAGNEAAHMFPVALRNEDTFDFSFSGVKTALRTALHALPDLDEQARCDIAASYQYALCHQLTDRAAAAAKTYRDAVEVHIVGGVSANRRLRSLLTETLSIPIVWPATLQYCTDNAAMIASGAAFLIEELGESAYAPFDTTATLPLESCVS
ncbi:MAG: tRNA (adenosine(37)-N6)-threonylcarbamoyltransferase complex transferase subunit TsaD [Candidatus Peregrinibacteria bacterium]|nr:tRNA (adenosine(37)-N6)-threonylcarbamoyltransferase complex transferase subunit TsaD [Candidatus Peregrinibacteria bacterium]MCB9808545.1 tRNA (adenosine(37)-N6)-threonylcarbamoyltransferase complex transferase subunit TsaD [Candidatus Peribacteria bacterium]